MPENGIQKDWLKGDREMRTENGAIADDVYKQIEEWKRKEKEKRERFKAIEDAQFATIDDAKYVITEFLGIEYDIDADESDFKDLENVGILYSTLGDGNEVDMQVYMDLINFKLKYEYTDENGVSYKYKNFNSLYDLINNLMLGYDIWDNAFNAIYSDGNSLYYGEE